MDARPVGNREWQPGARRPPRRDGTGSWRVVDRPGSGARRVWRGQADRSSPRRAAGRYDDPTTTGSLPPVSPGYGGPAGADVDAAPYRYPRPPDRSVPPSRDGDEERYARPGRPSAPPADDEPTTYGATYSGRRIGWPGTGEIPRYREYPTGRHAAVEEPEPDAGSSGWPGATTSSGWPTVPRRRTAARTAPTGQATPASPATQVTWPTRTERVTTTGQQAAVRLPSRATASPVPAGRAPAAAARAAGREAARQAGDRSGALEPDLVEPHVPWQPVLAWTIALFTVPMLAYLLWAWTRSGTPAAGCVDVADGACVAPRTAALRTFTNAFPGVVAALALSTLASAGLRLLNYAWRPVTIALGGAVIGAGLATVAASALG